MDHCLPCGRVCVCVGFVLVLQSIFHTAGPWCLSGSHVCSYSKSDVMFWNSLALPSENKSGGMGRVVSVDEDAFRRGFLRDSVLRIRLSPLARYKVIPWAALSLILGFVVTDSKLLCHLFFPCCYFYPIPSFSHQTIPVIKREKK